MPNDEIATVDADALRQRLRLLAHDLRSIVGPIAGYTDLIQNIGDLESAKHYADRIANASARIEAVTDSLVDDVLKDLGHHRQPRPDQPGDEPGTVGSDR